MPRPLPFVTSRQQLLLDLYLAYKDARRHKRGKKDQMRFERNCERELVALRDEILSRRYRCGPCSCFIIHDPKMREILAAPFRDRVVHHLLYNYLYRFLEPQFIRDSYSCLKGRGTHDGILCLEDKIRKVSKNYSRPCFILKLDIEGYFMQIDRERLLSLCKEMLSGVREQMDYPLVEYLLEETVRHNPLEGCIRVGKPSEWEGLPDKKSLFKSPPGRGLPIGNLTSQLFSNVYLHPFDMFMQALSGGHGYGRYVDDAYVVGSSPAALRAMIPKADTFLREQLGLALNRRKIAIHSAYRGVEFLGAYLKPFRRYVGNHCLRRMFRRVSKLCRLSPAAAACSINAYLGITSHYAAYRIRERWMKGPMAFAFRYGYFRNGILRFKVSRKDSG